MVAHGGQFTLLGRPQATQGWFMSGIEGSIAWVTFPKPPGGGSFPRGGNEKGSEDASTTSLPCRGKVSPMLVGRRYHARGRFPPCQYDLATMLGEGLPHASTTLLPGQGKVCPLPVRRRYHGRGRFAPCQYDLATMAGEDLPHASRAAGVRGRWGGGCRR